MQRHELRTDVQDRAGDPVGALVPERTVDTWLTLAVRSIWKEWPWPFTIKRGTVSAVSGTATISLPADTQRLTKVIDATNNNPLKPKSDRWLQDRFMPDDGNGSPRYYTDAGLTRADATSIPVRRMRLYPTPDQALTLNITYFSTPEAWSDDNHYPPLPEDFDEAIVQWVLKRYFRFLDDLQQAADAGHEYDREMSRLQGVYGTWQAEAYPVIEVD